ncbi:LuxR family transcriptional regulator [Protofrankia coriariae]|uniref:LuxR family transcriptional regulator n=1 Tax=Protofrankia coriariae TaxID=1562887 RepID=A0ABR5F210_9ACTN|nr:LuxR family transcriptional regulator [Protofrankia coriariae]
MCMQYDAVMELPWPLTGRAAELDLVRSSLTSHSPRSVMLVGPAGVGKTRLAREARLLASRAGLSSVWVTASHSIARTPLGVFVPLLPALDREPAGTVHDLLERSARALVSRARGRGVALFVDDAHMLDEASAGLLHQLVANHSVLVVLTVRAGEAAPEAVTALWKDDLALRLELSRLDTRAIDALLTAVLGHQVDRAAVVELAARSGGNVLYLRELTLGALADRTLVRDVGVWRLKAPLAPSGRIMELVDTRLRGLDDASIALLELAAYAEPLGGAEVAELADPELIDALQRQGLLASGFEGQRLQVRLAHPLYGEVLRARTSAVRVSAMSRALADSVERTGARRKGDALRMGIWRLDGGGGQPALMLRAARDARWHYDFALAERLARAAGHAGAGFDAWLLAGQTLALQGRPLDAERELASLTCQTRDDRDRVRLAIAHIDCLWFYLGRMDDGLRVAQLAEASITEQSLRDEVSARRAGLLLGSQGPGAAAEVAVPMLAAAKGPSLVWLGLVASYGLGRLGRIEEALDAADRGYDAGIVLSEPDDWYPWFNLYARCEALAHAGRFTEAEALARQEHQRGLEEGSSEARAWFLWHMCRTARDTGNVQSAGRDAREAIVLLRRLGRLGFQHSLLSLLAQSQALSGDHQGARATLARIDELGVQQPRWSWTEFISAHAWTAVAEGRLSVARETFERAAEAGERVGDRTGACAALHDIARIGAPHAVVDRLVAVAATVEGELTGARVAHVLALAEADPPGLAEVSDRFEAMGVFLLAAEAAADAAVAWRRLGKPRKADAELHRAAIRLSRCEGARTPALAPISVRSQLTPAERETALLAANGLTSKEIAEQLRISARTVDNRLQRIFRKLGISRRAELAALMR